MVILVGIVIFCKPVQFWNAYEPIVVVGTIPVDVVVEKYILVIEIQYINILAPIVVLLITTEVILVQYSKTLVPIEVI